MAQKEWFGHPRGLYTLFMTEVWERMSYYGMRALLILFMTASLENGGLGFSTEKGANVYGWYTAMVYATPLLGGFIADRFWGAQKTILIGAVLIALGHYALAVPLNQFFFLGLALIVVGTGMLKPNISASVGTMYALHDKRRDAGFSIFYMGVNLGAFIAPFICGTLGQKVGWHWGFGAAGVGMTLGIIQYVAGMKYIVPAVEETTDRPEGEEIEEPTETGIPTRVKTIGRAAVWLILVVWVYFTRSAFSAVVSIAAVSLLEWRGWWLWNNLSPIERKRVSAIFAFFVFATLFWAAFEQAGSSLNLYADRKTHNVVFGYAFPSTWHQSLNPIFIIALAPLFALLWIRLGKHEPSSPLKFAFGLVFVGLGFLVLAVSALINPEGNASPWWLFACYFFHTIGELCLSPVGLSITTKLAPQRMVGSMMGVWFLSVSFGSKLGGWVAGFFDTFPLPKLFGAVFLTTLAAAVLLFGLIRPIRKLMSGVH